MNERIRELADQLAPVATIGNWGRVEWPINVFPSVGDKMYAAIDLQEFAELIVRECALVNFRSDFSDGEFHAREVLEHFGVEE